MGKMTMRPSKPLSTGALIGLAFMLMFGIAFSLLIHTVLTENDAPLGMSIVFYLFMVGWIATALYPLVYHALNLKRAKGFPLVDIESEPGLPEETTQSDPMQRLRNLEKLKSDGLITEEDEMSNRRWIVVLITLALCFACLPGKAALCADDYSVLLAKAKDFDKTVDFKALRLAYTKTPDYNPYGRDNKMDDAMEKALEEKKFEEAIKIAQTILEKNYVHIFAHFVSRIAYRELGNQKKFEYHHFVANGLIQSILRSGSGLDPEGALLVISTDEEYMILDVLGLKSRMQSTLKVADQTYDKLSVVDRKTGEAREMYFNVTIPFGWLSRQFEKKGS